MHESGLFGRLSNFLRQFLRFGFVGAIVAVLQGGGYALLVYLGWAGPLLANLLAFVPATAVSFALHFAWTFRSARRPVGAAWRFGAAKLSALGLNTAGVWLVKDGLGASPYAALPIMLLVTPLALFTLSKYWAFRDTASARRDRGRRGRCAGS